MKASLSEIDLSMQGIEKEGTDKVSYCFHYTILLYYVIYFFQKISTDFVQNRKSFVWNKAYEYCGILVLLCLKLIFIISWIVRVRMIKPLRML